MKPNKGLEMLGFVPQPNLHRSDFLAKTYAVLEQQLLDEETKLAYLSDDLDKIESALQS